MSKRAILLGLVLLCVIGQGLLHHFGVPEWGVPQGVVVCVVFLAFYDCSVPGAVVAWLAGLLLDLSSATVLGPWAGACVFVYLVLASLSQRLFVESVLVAMVVTAASTLATGLAYLLLAYEYQAISVGDATSLLGQAFASALVAPWLMGVMKRLYRRANPISIRRSSVISTV